MSAKDLSFYRERLRRFGRWAGVRYMRNRGVPFNQAYYVVFGRMPREIAVTL